MIKPLSPNLLCFEGKNCLNWTRPLNLMSVSSKDKFCEGAQTAVNLGSKSFKNGFIFHSLSLLGSAGSGALSLSVKCRNHGM